MTPQQAWEKSSIRVAVADGGRPNFEPIIVWRQGDEMPYFRSGRDAWARCAYKETADKFYNWEPMFPHQDG